MDKKIFHGPYRNGQWQEAEDAITTDLQQVQRGDIARLVELDQSAASQHLAKLRKVGLVETRRHGQQIFHECRAPEVSRVLSALITNDISQRYPTNL
ncbi:ArsR/SmtB family transcription factor [Rhizobium esperanzae]|uniref:DNA-binding transcriptional ArsR family regulator n=1 Tax=Rhizobium esperanzae TaxID=1967781 RepID=A0A7W6W565_9HYPH|nr:ArsR family transcriptional regulator [Rhizobium esperanzae]MBB4235875.1 DNA-binding transcriptional ArsR family regulator [Rhizobium esperanzae]